MYYATRYQEAVALPSIDTETVAEALVSMFNRVMVPKDVLTDMVSQVILIVEQYVSMCMLLIQLVMSLHHICGIMHRSYVESDESQLKSGLQVYSTTVVDDSSEMFHENYEGLVKSPSISDDGG